MINVENWYFLKPKVQHGQTMGSRKTKGKINGLDSLTFPSHYFFGVSCTFKCKTYQLPNHADIHASNFCEHGTINGKNGLRVVCVQVFLNEFSGSFHKDMLDFSQIGTTTNGESYDFKKFSDSDGEYTNDRNASSLRSQRGLDSHIETVNSFVLRLLH